MTRASTIGSHLFTNSPPPTISQSFPPLIVARLLQMAKITLVFWAKVAQSYLSALERGEKEPGAAVLMAISREFGKACRLVANGEDTH